MPDVMLPLPPAKKEWMDTCDDLCSDIYDNSRMVANGLYGTFTLLVQGGNEMEWCDSEIGDGNVSGCGYCQSQF
jgi:hypothetical protein